MGRQLHRGSNYTDKLFRLIPAEFVSVYLAISQLVSSNLDMRQPVLLCIVVLFSLLIPIYLWKVIEVKGKPQIVLTTISFLVWTYTLGDAYEPGKVFETNLHYPVIASVGLLLWTSIVPLFHLDTDKERINEK